MNIVGSHYHLGYVNIIQNYNEIETFGVDLDSMKKDPFQEYLIHPELNKKYKGYAWNTAIGLQAVDGLKSSHKKEKCYN